MNLQQFGATIKEKYPQYKDMSDEELGSKMLEKYPQYKDIVILEEPIKKPEVKTGLSGVGQLVGESLALNTKDYQGYQKSSQDLGDMNLKLLQTIRENKKLGKDTTRLEQQYKINTGNEVKFEDIAPSSQKTNKGLAGDLLQTASYFALPLSAGSVAGRVGIGATMGGVTGVGSGMSENKDTADIVKQGLVGASIGAFISGAFEAVGAGLRKLSESRAVLNKTANTYNKELQPSKRDLINQIQNSKAGEAFKTIGSRIRDEVDDAGKPLYVGTYTTIMDKAKNNISQKGQQLLKVLGQYDDTVKINKNEIAGDIVNQLTDAMGTLKPSELKVVQTELKRIGEKEINPTQALAYKRLYDSKIPDSFWADTADRTKAVAIQARYIIRDNLRKLINEKTGDALVQKLNTSMGLAMDVRRLSAAQIALRSTEKIGAGEGEISPWRAVYGTLIDDMFFNPALTTRFAQGLKAIGQKTGQTPLRATARNLLINKSTKQ